MKGIDIYRLIGMCVVLVAAWVAQVVGFSTFRVEVRNGPPKMNIVDYEKDFSGNDEDRPMVEIAREKGWDIHAGFVTASEARRRVSEYERKKWLGLFAGLGGAVGVFLIAYKLWDDFLIGIACVFLGPLGISWGILRSNRNG